MDSQMALNRAISALGPDVWLPCWADPDDWFSDDPLVRHWAGRACAGCPVQIQCLGAAFSRGEKSGVWGGVEFPHLPPVPDDPGPVVAVTAVEGGR